LRSIVRLYEYDYGPTGYVKMGNYLTTWVTQQHHKKTSSLWSRFCYFETRWVEFVWVELSRVIVTYWVRFCQWLPVEARLQGSYISSIDVLISPLYFVLQRKSPRKDTLDARCYWSRKQEHLIKARTCIVVLVTSTREWLDSKSRR
jgi:hypothetical protein